MRYFCLCFVLIGCGSVDSKPIDAHTSDTTSNGDTSGDTEPACGAAGQACCASMCNTGLSCTTSDQVCRSAQVWLGGFDSNSGKAIVAHGSGTSFMIDIVGDGNIASLWGTSSSDVWVSGVPPLGSSATPFLRHWNGFGWETALPMSANYYGLWGDAPSNYWAINTSGGAIHFNGTSWSSPVTAASQTLIQIWGSSATDVWAVGGGVTVAHLDSSASWTSATRTDFSVSSFGSISGRKSTGEFYSGGASGANPAVLHRVGTTFTVEAVPGCIDARGVWAGPTGAWAVTAPLIGGNCQPGIAHVENGAWVDKGQQLGTATSANNMWGTSDRDIYVNATTPTGPVVFHYDGTSWTPLYAPATGASNFFPVWGTGGSN